MSRFDVVVVGGGPAGMMAAARAAQFGARTALIEKNRELGQKLMLTGRGRCNYAHDEEDPEILSKDYRNGGDFLLPSLQKFGTKETVAFFLRRGVAPSHERGRRIYPKEGQDATAILTALWTALKDGGVQVLRGIEVRSIDMLGGKARRLITTKEEIEGRAFIIATGGLSFPNTGSTGDGYRFAKKAGHEITETSPALCPVKVAERIDSYLDGLKLKNVRVTLTQDGEKTDERFGEMDFTHFGISGAIIMDMASSVAVSLKKSQNVKIHIDLKPALEPERLDARIERDFTEFSGDALRFALRKMLPAQMIPEVITRAGLDMGKPCGETTPEERLALRNTMKDFALTPTDLLGFRHAIITSGGINTDSIDPETMASKFVPNLYFAGEVLNVDGPTGGYNLQECWSTGFAAGSAAAAALGFAEPTDEEIVKQMFAAQTRRYEFEREEKAKAKQAALLAEANKPTDETDSSAITEDSKEQIEEMTIKTGPTDDKEFCGWRDPRKENATSGIISASEEANTAEQRDEKKNNYSDRDSSKDGRPRRYGDERYGNDRREGYRPRRDDGERYGDRRPSDDRRPYGDRPSYRSRDERYGNDRRDGYRPRRDDGERYGDRRPSDDRRPYGDRPSYRSRDERYGNDRRDGYRPRRDDGERYGDRRPSDDRRPYGDGPSYRGRDERYGNGRRDGYKPRRDDGERYGERKRGTGSETAAAQHDKTGETAPKRRFTNFEKFRKKDDTPAE